MVGGSSGDSTSGRSSSTVSKEEVTEKENSDMVMEVSDESELELGLGLGLGLGLSLGVVGSKNYKQVPKILSVKELPSMVSRPNLVPPSPPSASSCSSLGLRASANDSTTNTISAGTKRAASPTGVSQVVGWPPIRAYRMNSMANQAKSIANGDHNSEFDGSKGKDVIYSADDKGKTNPKDRVSLKSSLFVKVNMDGVAIGRKVDLSAHSSYESLAQTLEEMFTNTAVEKTSGEELILMPKVTRSSKLLDGSSDYVLTYEDKDGDWMLVGDVPWGMFFNSVKRLRIMKTSETNGLAPRSEERSTKQRSRPI